MAKRLNAGGIDRMTAAAAPIPPERPAGEQPAAQHSSDSAPPAPTPAPSAPAAATEQPAAEHRAVERSAVERSEQPATPPPALSGQHAHVGAEPDVYRPDGEHSLVRDAFHARIDGDQDAAARLSRYRSQIGAFAEEQNRRSRRGQFAGTGDHPEIIPPGYRGDLLVDPISAGRPLWSLLTSRGAVGVTLTDATPFKIPVRGGFSGVGDHVEGTAHVAAGTLTTDEVTVSPKPISGAFEVSRELVDSSNPAIDAVAMASMREDYEDQTNAYAYAQATASLTPVLSIDSGDLYEAELVKFFTTRKRPADFAIGGSTYYTARATEQAGDGRPRYPYINPMNASGTTGSGFESISIQGKPLVLDDAGSTAGLTRAVIAKASDFLVGESNVLTFRFDEVSGPGIIKLALWSYVGVQRLRDEGAVVVDSASS